MNSLASGIRFCTLIVISVILLFVQNMARSESVVTSSGEGEKVSPYLISGYVNVVQMPDDVAGSSGKYCGLGNDVPITESDDSGNEIAIVLDAAGDDVAMVLDKSNDADNMDNSDNSNNSENDNTSLPAASADDSTAEADDSTDLIKESLTDVAGSSICSSMGFLMIMGLFLAGFLLTKVGR